VREPGPDYSARRYDRPNQSWVCGLAIDGEVCPAGPTARGRCPALAECAPLREGDRWQCNRSTVRGGVCDEGPTPDGGCGRVRRCRPMRSLRAIRRRFVTACMVLAGGGLSILLSADWRNHAIAPGPLAQPHAQLFNRAHGEAKCSACHAAGDEGLLEWTTSPMAAEGTRPSQPQLCLECHDTTIPSQLALTAHNLPREHLLQLTGERSSGSRGAFSSVLRAALSPGSQLACAACHREHHGEQFHLTAMNNAACQACHQQRYESFAADHPDFGVWPYERRTRIAFNHASHRAKHFADKQQAFDCRRCHVEDATGTVQLTVGYDLACAACHDERIATSVARGMPMIALPTLDVDALREAGHDIGPWPEHATGDFDGRLPSAMKLLLASDPAATEAIAKLGDDFDFFDVDPDDTEQLAACATLAAAIRELFIDFGKSEAGAVRERLTAALGGNVTAAEAAALVAGLSSDTLRGAAWLPQSERDLTNTALPSAEAKRPASLLATSFAPGGSWFRDDATLSIRYRPAAHADPVLASWLNLLTRSDLPNQPITTSAFKELGNPLAPGLCVSCHGVEQTSGRALTINWRSYDGASASRAFTKFSHGPHLVLPQLADCTQCHEINDAADAAASYVDRNPHRFASEFRPISKRQCAECHTATAAGDRCQSCHNYHVNDGVGP
jgi:hypothetical protein